MKTLLLPLLLITFLTSCSRDCDEAKDQYYKEYLQALQGAKTPEAATEITRQYNNRIDNLDC